jgi:hypothetical protein
MNRKQFQQLKQYVGTALLNYILNFNDINNKSDFDKLEIQPVHLKVLDDLYANIQQCRILFIERGGFGDGVDLYLKRLTSNGTSLFNNYRLICGGQLILPTSTDPLISFLQQICIREYPNLLMKTSGTTLLEPWFSINLGMDHYEEFIRLVKEDVLDKITNNEDSLDYRFQFSTTDGLEFNMQVCSACNTIITRSFFDSCNRMDYSLPTILETIEENVNLLRRLANKLSVTYSSFIGLRGLNFQGFDAIEFSGGVLRQFRDIANPGIHTNETVVGVAGTEGEEYSGHIFEIYHSTKILTTSGLTNTGNSIIINRFQQTELQKLQFAIVFSSLANYGPVPSFIEIGFPLVYTGTGSTNDKYPRNYILIDEMIKTKIIDWYGVLHNKDLERVQSPLKRLQYAIFERNNPEDSIVDAIIAWEGMFSEAFETTFKVTGSIAKFLRSGSKRVDFFMRLKKLYDLRSVLVHGGTSDLLKKENINDIREEVINIGLECMMKIIRNDQLLSLTPPERVKTILVLDDLDSKTNSIG